MGIFTWIILGGLAGWIASLVMRTDDEQGIGGNIVVGMIGALIGGLVSNAFGGPSITGLNLRSMLVAVLGSILVLAFVRMLSRRTT